MPTIPKHRSVLVVGAGGYLGSAVSRALVEAGWTVRGLVREGSSARRLESMAVRPFVGSVLDPGAVARSIRGCEAVVHLATVSAPGPPGSPTAEQVRVEGCQNLLRAGRENGVARLVVGSGYWVYADQPNTITEESALDPRGESRVNRSTEVVALDPVGHGSMEVLVVRPGMVYGNGSWFRSMVAGILDGTYRVIGDGANPWSFVALDDAGEGFVRVLETGRAGEVYNLVDGRPAAWREFSNYVADRLSRDRPPSVSSEEAEAAYGADIAHHLGARRACSAGKVSGLGWKPRFPEYRSGLDVLLPRMVDDRGSGEAAR